MIPPKPKSDTAGALVRFPNFFTNKCQPIVTTGIVSDKIKVFAVIQGINGMQPDHTGFEVQVNIAAEATKQDKIAKSFFVTWQALGY